MKRVKTIDACPKKEVVPCPACKGTGYVLSPHAPKEKAKLAFEHIQMGEETWLVLCEKCGGTGFREPNDAT